MLLHPPIIIFIFALALGVGGITYLIQLYERYGFRYLKLFCLFSFFLNLALTTRLIQYYFAKNIIPQDAPIGFWSVIIPETILFCCFLLQILSAVLMFSKIKDKKRITNKKTSMFFLVMVFLMFIFITVFKTNLVKHLLGFLSAIPIFYGFCTLLFCFFVIRETFLKINSMDKKPAFPLLNFFSIYFLIQFCLITLVRFFLTIKAFCEKPFFLLPLPIYYLLSNVAILAISIIVLKKNHTRLLREENREESLKNLSLKYKLSKREHEVIKLMCQGKTNREISDLLYVTLNTIKFHLSNIYKKTDVKSRVQLINKIFDQ